MNWFRQDVKYLNIWPFTLSKNLQKNEAKLKKNCPLFKKLVLNESIQEFIIFEFRASIQIFYSAFDI